MGSVTFVSALNESAPAIFAISLGGLESYKEERTMIKCELHPDYTLSTIPNHPCRNCWYGWAIKYKLKEAGKNCRDICERFNKKEEKPSNENFSR